MKTLAAEGDKKTEQGRVINDFSIHVATVNGSGSQSSNSVLMRSIFQMGIPVSGKNLFPSNIAGLPTWFTIRVNKAGYIARRCDNDIMVAMNPQTAVDDVKSLKAGAVCISPVELKLDQFRSDVKHYQVPFTELAAKASPEQVKLRKLLTNMIYVGVVAELLNLDDAEIAKSIESQFAGKPKAIPLNVNAIKVGRDWTRENLKKDDPYFIERMNETAGKIIIDGNAAAALGCMFAGATVISWYPITPSSSLCETLIDYLHEYRNTEDGKHTYAVIQAEDELAAVGMALGAGWAGARSMTSTSGPGISLMSEFVGFGYFTEIPTVIFDVQRVGPSTGLPTRTSQADLLPTHILSHGDTKHIVLLPGTVEECYTLAMKAFDLAERFQTPVFVLTDLDLGMNNWMSDPFTYPTQPHDRGKVLTAEDLEKLGKFERYKDVDGDGICYRTLPGTDHALAPYFVRGSGHSEKATYTEKPDDYKNLMDRLDRKFQTARKHVPEPIVDQNAQAKIGLIAFGSTHFAVIESRDQLKGTGTQTSYLRLRALPFTEDLRKFVESHDHVYVIEQNRDAQLRDLIRLELPEYAMKIRSIRHYDGLPVDAQFVTDAIKEQEKK